MANGIRDVMERFCHELDKGGEAVLICGLRAELTSLLSPETLSSAFSVNSSYPTVESPGIDYLPIQSAFECVAKHAKGLNLVAEIIQEHLPTLGQRLQEAPEDIGLLRTIPVLLHCPVLLRPDQAWCRKLLVELAQTLLQLQQKCHTHFHTIEQWLGNDQALLKRTVLDFHGGLQGLMRSKAYKEIGTLDAYLAVLGIMSKINEDNRCPVSRRLFCIDDLEENCDLDAHFYVHVMQVISRSQEQNIRMPKMFSWISVPFVLNVRAKWKFLSLQARFMQEGQAQMAEMENFVRLQQNMTLFARLFPQTRLPPLSTTLRFDVDRENIIHSAIENVKKYWQDSEEPNLVFLKPLEINFKGESAVDLGGPSKDFFYQLFLALMDPSLPFFMAFDEKSVSSDVWFNPKNTELRALEEIGLLFALLIFNGAIVTVPFPVQLYEKLLFNRDPTPTDLEEMDPEFVKGLQDLRKMSADGLEAMYLDFEGLQPGGENVCVDKENLEQYIDERIANRLALFHLGVFAKGFRRLASMTPLMREIFTAEDLRDVILGEELDWKAFRQSAYYERPYSEDHPVIKMFWKVFHELDERDKRKFLSFLTGADHVPLGGFEPFPVRKLDNMDEKRRDRCDPTKYPEPDDLGPKVMTCKGCLSMDLPQYTKEEHLRFKLLDAIQCKGFNREAPR